MSVCHYRSRVVALLFLLTCSMTTAMMAQDKQSPIVGPSRPSGPEFQTRSVTVARNGMACTSDPRATLAALEVLQRGGSAVDAAIAANAMLGVVEPMSCGIGGDLFAIVWDAKTKTLHGLNASGRAPKSLTRQHCQSLGLEVIPSNSPLSWTVPGCVSGWDDLHKKFGKLPWKELFSSSIREAEEGFPVSPIISGYWRASEKKLSAFPTSKATLLFDNGEAPRTGDIFKNPHLATSYRLIAEQGADAFYRGSIAERIVAFSNANKGFFSLQDFAEHKNTWDPPVSVDYRGYKVWELPPNGQGIAALEMLQILKQHDLKSLGWGTPDYLHLLIEAKKLAYADRARYYADPTFVDVPVAELISEEYALKQNARINMQKAATDIPPGDPRPGQADTIYLCVVDKDRNCCSLIQSNYHGFGSGIVPDDVGFAIQDRGSLFALQDDHPNRLEPGKRPFHTIIPAMVTKDDLPVMVLGLMGGDMQAQGHVQVLINWIDFGMNIQMAGDAGRFNHEGSATPTGLKGDAKGGVVQLEPTFPAATMDALRQRGHVVDPVRGSGYGGYQAIHIDWARGILEGATESRKDGMAIGY
ncbi:MAG: gamma-glutamyltransferase [Planctomycetes bacterium]|nr:gamma-glutamyltransferase [Planctomycetota bacterium]